MKSLQKTQIPHCTVRAGRPQCAIRTLSPLKVYVQIYTVCLLVSVIHCQIFAIRCHARDLWSFEPYMWAISNIGDFWEGMLVLEENTTCFFSASSSDVNISKCFLRAKNLAFLELLLQSFSSELPLVVPLPISDLALAFLGNALLLGGEGQELSLPKLVHTLKLAGCYLLLLLEKMSALLFPYCVNGIMHSLVENCHFWEGTVHWSSCQIARLWGGESWSFLWTCFMACVIFREYFILLGCSGPRSLWIDGTATPYYAWAAGWSFLRNFTLGGCGSPEMRNAFGFAVVTPLNLELATWLGGGKWAIEVSLASPASISLRSWTHTPIDTCDNSSDISKSGSAGSMVLLGGKGCLLHLAGMCLTLVTGLPSNLVCFLGLMALLSGTNVSAM